MCSGQDIVNYMRSDGVDINCAGGLIGCRCLVKTQAGLVINKTEGTTDDKVANNKYS